MTERALDGVRERDERDARFFAWDVPGDAHIVALVHEAGDSERSATVADAIATSIARRREHTLLLSAEAGPSPLDELLGAANSPGLPAALEGRARLTDVAVQRVDRPFVYLPGGGDPVAMRALLEDEVLASFVERVRERGGTLFIVLSEETLQLDGLRTLIDGYVALGDVTLPKPASELAQFGRVRYENGDSAGLPEGNGSLPRAVADLPELPPLPEPTESASTPSESTSEPSLAPTPEALPDTVTPSGSATVESSGTFDGSEPEPIEAATLDPIETDGEDAVGSTETWQRHRNDPGFPVRNVVIGVAAIAAVTVLWWVFARGVGGGSEGPATAGAPVTGAVAATPTPVSAPAVSFDDAAARAAFESAPELGYSVMIASFAARADAEDRLLQLGSTGSGFYFVSPTPVRGVVYHRVFAGALANRDEAQSLMDDLVASGIKGEGGAWHLRPASLAFDLGLFPDRAAAEQRVVELASKSIPAYVLMAPATTGTVWRVYGGAYVDDAESLPMGEMLTAAGEPVELVTRHGTIP